MWLFVLSCVQEIPKVVQRFGTCLRCLDERDIPSKFAVSTPDTV